MRFVVVTKDKAIVTAAKEGFHPKDVVVPCPDWTEGLEACKKADMIFVDILATLSEPHKIAGYERFARAKMTHPVAVNTPLVVIAPDKDYELDFMSGWPDFVFAHLPRPIDCRVFRRASTWV